MAQRPQKFLVPEFAQFWVASTSAIARATRWQVPSMVSSIGRPSLAFNRYF
jgi:hypothetical protein